MSVVLDVKSILDAGPYPRHFGRSEIRSRYCSAGDRYVCSYVIGYTVVRDDVYTPQVAADAALEWITEWCGGRWYVHDRRTGDTAFVQLWTGAGHDGARSITPPAGGDGFDLSEVRGWPDENAAWNREFVPGWNKPSLLEMADWIVAAVITVNELRPLPAEFADKDCVTQRQLSAAWAANLIVRQPDFAFSVCDRRSNAVEFIVPKPIERP